MENATSDDSVKIDEDLVAALGFEPANDILIVDDSLNDELSISSDDIRVSTKSGNDRSSSKNDKAEADAKKKAESKAKGEAKLAAEAKRKADAKAKAEAKSKAKAEKAKPDADKSDAGKAETGKADAGKAETGKVEAKKTNLEDRLNADSKIAETADVSNGRAKVKPPKPQTAKKTATPKSDTTSSLSKGSEAEAKSTGSSKTAETVDGDSPTPPPPTAANAVLISEPSPSAYGFSDVQLPDFKGALAKFTRRGSTKQDESAAEVTANVDSLVAEVAATTADPIAETGSVIDARVATSPPLTSAPSTATPATSPPTVTPEPDIQIIETPAEPNVYVTPTRSGRTRIRSRKVRRQIRHIDPWSVLTFSVIFHACVFGAMLLASILVWRFADGAGLIEKTESFWAELADKPDFEIDQAVLVRAVAMIAGLMAIASSVLMVLLTVFFNLISDIVGGIRVTVIEEEPVRVTK